NPLRAATAAAPRMRHVSIKAYLESVTFNGSQTVDLPESGVLVLVAPNNTGKSAALREIHHHLTAQPRPMDQPVRVVHAIDLHKDGDGDALTEWLEQNNTPLHGGCRGQP